jgi:hypothetical protein
MPAHRPRLNKSELIADVLEAGVPATINRRRCQHRRCLC